MKMLFQAEGAKYQGDLTILICNKIDIKLKLFYRDREGHFILIKGKIDKEDFIILNIHAPHSDKKFMKEI